MDFIRIVLLPAVPLVLLLLCIAVALGQQDFYWQLISVVGQKSQTVPVWVSMTAFQYGPRPDLIASVLRMYGLPLAIVSFLILLPFQIFYLDRLALSTSQNTDREEQTEKSEQEKTLPDF